jgi:hypothetical protein
MKKIIIFILGSVTFVQIATAQKNSNDSALVHRSEVINLKIKDLASVVKLSPDRKQALTIFLTKEQRALDSAVAHGATINQLMPLKAKFHTELETILTKEELEAYALKRKQAQGYKPILPL